MPWPAGADGVELDVRRSADGDARRPPRRRRRRRRGSSTSVGATELPAWVPTLEDALAACAGAVVNVEIKNIPTDPGYDPANRCRVDVAAALARAVGAGHRGRRASWCRRSGPTPLRRASASARPARPWRSGSSSTPRSTPAGALETAAALGCAALHPHHSPGRPPTLVAGRTTLGLAVVTWTVNSPGTSTPWCEPGSTP